MTLSDEWARPANLRSRRLIRLLHTVLDTVCGTPEGYLLHRSRHELACGDCDRAWSISPGIKAVERDICGTNDGWMAHRRRKEWPCPRCSVAREAHEADLCGTLAGWMVHRRSGTVICGRCRIAHLAYQEARRARLRADREPLPLPGPNLDLRTRTGRLRRELRRGAVLVCTTAPFAGHAVLYAPRWASDSTPWALATDLSTRLAARDCRAVHHEGDTT